ncbi:MAG: HD domain-containing protein, partial [Bacteroidota bacterium]
MENETLSDEWIDELLAPETQLEEAILRDPKFRAGLLWGKPRFGHPEGKIVYHIREVLDNVDRLCVDQEERRQLRLITYIHDTFKYLEDKSSHPRDWSRHHAVYARKFAARFIDDAILLDIIELHDDAYYSWRLTHLYNQPERGQQRLERLLERVGERLQLYYLF